MGIKIDVKFLNRAEETIKSLEERLSCFRDIYDKANHLLSVVGAEGEINAQDKVCNDLMGALHSVDDGVFDTDKVFNK